MSAMTDLRDEIDQLEAALVRLDTELAEFDAFLADPRIRKCPGALAAIVAIMRPKAVQRDAVEDALAHARNELDELETDRWYRDTVADINWLRWSTL